MKFNDLYNQNTIVPYSILINLLELYKDKLKNIKLYLKIIINLEKFFYVKQY